jgi:hypothetical protein
MYLSLNLKDFNKDFIIIGNKSKNIIIENSDFYNLHYSTKYFTLNNISFDFIINNIIIENYYNKYKCNFLNNAELIKQIINIEKIIINNFPSTKQPIYKLEEQLLKKNFKILNDNNLPINKNISMNILLKISGIWVNDINYGIIYKFQLINYF